LAPGASGYVVPNGVDTAYFKKIEDRKEKIEDAIVFTGSMDWLPNNDAALYFCKDILPLIWQTEPGVKFYIVGKGASAGLTEYAKRDRRIVLTGRVDDVRVFVERSKVFAVPLRIGGGTRLKILEALSMEKAVVSTTIGAEGISHQNGHNIVLADEPGAFAENVVQLLKDPQRCASLGKAGRDLVIEKYEWNVIGSKLKDIYETIKV
jgi:glycosyltransferase involved in cell wall biosynthesis